MSKKSNFCLLNLVLVGCNDLAEPTTTTYVRLINLGIELILLHQNEKTFTSQPSGWLELISQT